MKNILLNQFPESLDINGESYVINSDFRIGIQFEIMMQDSSIDNASKIYNMLMLYYNKIPENITEAVQRALWFYSCGHEPTKQNNINNSQTLYSFEFDQFMIYTDFIYSYQIDLTKTENMHWWKFKQLFLNLNEQSEIKKVMGYRSIKINSKMPKEQKAFYLKMKRLYKLPLKQDLQDKATTIANVLNRGITPKVK